MLLLCVCLSQFVSAHLERSWVCFANFWTNSDAFPGQLLLFHVHKSLQCFNPLRVFSRPESFQEDYDDERPELCTLLKANWCETRPHLRGYSPLVTSVCSFVHMCCTVFSGGFLAGHVTWYWKNCICKIFSFVGFFSNQNSIFHDCVISLG